MKLLPLYDKKVKEDKRKYITIKIPLTPEFKRICRKRIVEGHKKYGNDWVYKDNLKEIEFEKYDIYNYEKLHACQMEHQAENHPLHIG